MKKYSGFTLIEMLIVMGIIIILMAAGIAGGRFAIQRANRIQKQNAVENISQALWGYYTDNRGFPTAQSPEALLDPAGVGGPLFSYLDAGQWDGGSDGDFGYWVDDGDFQTFVACATLGGVLDVQGYGVYCTGNGLQLISPFNDLDTVPGDNIYLPSDPIYGDIYLDIIACDEGDCATWEERNWQ